jgi:hypothetical protein
MRSGFYRATGENAKDPIPPVVPMPFGSIFRTISLSEIEKTGGSRTKEPNTTENNFTF